MANNGHFNVFFYLFNPKLWEREITVFDSTWLLYYFWIIGYVSLYSLHVCLIKLYKCKINLKNRRNINLNCIFMFRVPIPNGDRKFQWTKILNILIYICKYKGVFRGFSDLQGPFFTTINQGHVRLGHINPLITWADFGDLSTNRDVAQPTPPLVISREIFVRNKCV